MDSTGQQVTKQTTQQAITVNQANTLNANASKGEVTVSGKNVKFSARSAQRQSLAV